jgi:hypothetical protein
MGAVTLRAGRAVHFITPPFEEVIGLASIAIDARITGPSEAFSLTVVVQDPLDPRLDLTCVPLALQKEGRLQLLLDIPDQVLLAGSHVWLTLRADREVRVSGPDGGAPQIRLRFVPRDKALPEALAWRKLLLKSFFSLLSEPRPWGGYRRNMSREEFYESSRYAQQCPELFMTIDQCHALAPADDTVRQYREWVYLRHLDRISEVSPPPAPPDGVPAWAWYPRLAWLETRRIAEWWLDERLVATGEFGGRVGDDSDFYQQFTDFPFFETDGVAGRMKDAAAWMAELAQAENLRGGINRNATDALHAYEEGINHLALMARWFYGDPIYLERCMESARNMEKLTIVTEDGRRHFRDTERMGARDTDRPSKPAVEGHAAPLMWHTALQVAEYNRNPRALRTLREWADSWLRFQEPGRWATAVEVLTGKVVAASKNRPLYGGYRTQGSVFTWLFSLTGDKKYIDPFLHFYRQGQAPYPASTYCADVYVHCGLAGLDSETAKKVARSNAAAWLYVTGDPKPLIEETIGRPRSTGQAISDLYSAQRWRDMYTKTHQFTDRIFPSILQNGSIAYLGGYCRRNKFNPSLAVGWEGFGTLYSTLVLKNRPDRLKVAVYSFADRTMPGRMRVWLLEHGNYTITMGRDSDGDMEIDSVKTEKTEDLSRADAIELSLQPGQVTIVEIEQAERLDSIYDRPDLAVTAREVAVNGQSVTATVHNIGAMDVKDVVVTVVDDEGKTLARKSLGPLAAPLDLVPRRTSVTLPLSRIPPGGSRLLVDPEDTVPEIYEGNNAVALDRLR